MPLTTTSNREDFVASSGQTVFAYTFRVDLATDLQVYQQGTLLTLITNYTVSGLGNPAGGNVTLVVGATAADAIAILRVVPLTQLSDYVANEGIPAERIELDYEKLTMIAQQQQEQVFARTVSLLPSSIINNLTMPDPVASNFIRWKNDLTGFENVAVTLTQLPTAVLNGLVNEIAVFGAGGTSLVGNANLIFIDPDMTILGKIIGNNVNDFLDLNAVDGVRLHSADDMYFKMNALGVTSAEFRSFIWEFSSGAATGRVVMELFDSAAGSFSGPGSRSLHLHGDLFFDPDGTHDIGNESDHRLRNLELTGNLTLTTNGAVVRARNLANTAYIDIVKTGANDAVMIAPGGVDILWGTPLVALGGGATALVGTIGGTGPATAAQNAWMRVLDNNGVAFWLPGWK